MPGILLNQPVAGLPYKPPVPSRDESHYSPILTNPTPKRLVLCFDGTGNSFQGNTSDTNIVKLYNALGRRDPSQLHYYQPGIGTYSTDASSLDLSLWGKLKRRVDETIDQGFATSFDSHVMAGYRFLMRFYAPGDKIYIFGFSRGAFTARFLARMLANVGLLSMGNEEMVPFAYKAYQDYELGKDDSVAFMKNFKMTFCRDDLEYGEGGSEKESGIKTHFLGLFDTVSSVAYFDPPGSQQPNMPVVYGTARHIRHAVSIDERRVEFRPALLAQDRDAMSSEREDIKEVWFAGNHGDVGGGWPAEAQRDRKKLSVRDRIAGALVPSIDHRPSTDKRGDSFQLSDVALKWMMDELDGLADDRISWNSAVKEDYLARFAQQRHAAAMGRLHDPLSIGGGSSLGSVLLWNMLEYLPFIRRYEYYPANVAKGKSPWQYVALPLNRGRRRDIPPGAHFHHSVLERLATPAVEYAPANELFVGNGGGGARERLRDVDTREGTRERGAESTSTAASSSSSRNSRNSSSSLTRPYFVLDRGASTRQQAEDALYYVQLGSTA